MLNAHQYSNLLITNLFLLLFIYYNSNATPYQFSNNMMKKNEDVLRQYQKIYYQNQSNGLQYAINGINEPIKSYNLHQQVTGNQRANELCNKKKSKIDY